MIALPKQTYTVDEYLAWAETCPGRYELYAGKIYAQAPQRAGHAKVKYAVQKALEQAISTAGIACHMMPDGMTVRVDDTTAFEPDALVYCGTEIANNDVEVANPVIVVEVLSPSTRHIDGAAKLMGYFQVPSIEHYLIIDPLKRPMLHHQRQSDGTILTKILTDGSLKLDPPGIELDIDRLFETA